MERGETATVPMRPRLRVSKTNLIEDGVLLSRGFKMVKERR